MLSRKKNIITFLPRSRAGKQGHPQQQPGGPGGPGLSSGPGFGQQQGQGQHQGLSQQLTTDLRNLGERGKRVAANLKHLTVPGGGGGGGGGSPGGGGGPPGPGQRRQRQQVCGISFFKKIKVFPSI